MDPVGSRAIVEASCMAGLPFAENCRASPIGRTEVGRGAVPDPLSHWLARMWRVSKPLAVEPNTRSNDSSTQDVTGFVVASARAAGIQHAATRKTPRTTDWFGARLISVLVRLRLSSSLPASKNWKVRDNGWM